MSSSRLIRDGWIDSPAINALSPEAEAFFLRLCLRADDHGRYHANPKLLMCYVAPLRSWSEQKIKAMLAECSTAGLIIFYEAAKTTYLSIPKFNQRTRGASKFPDPEPRGQVRTIDGGLRTSADKCSEEIKLAAVVSEARSIDSLDGDGDGDGDGDVLLLGVKRSKPNQDDPFWNPETGFVHITSELMEKWSETYPAVSIETDLREMDEWLRSNPSKAKKKLWRKFITGWLGRTQEKGGSRGFNNRPNNQPVYQPNLMDCNIGLAPEAFKVPNLAQRAKEASARRQAEMDGDAPEGFYGTNG